MTDSCPICKSKDIEKFSDNHSMCRNCGVGTSGKLQINRKNYLAYITKNIMLVKQKHPELSPDEVARETSRVLHKMEKHPVRKDGYCEYCEVMIK